MKDWLHGKRGGLAAFLGIAALVAGGLGWATAAALRLEQERLEARAQAEQADKLRLALWRLDSWLSPTLAKEDSRPYDHYSAVFAPPLACNNEGVPWQPGTVLEPSPLLSAELPDWMLLHFQVNAELEWASPQVLSPTLVHRLHNDKVQTPLAHVTPQRQHLLAELARSVTAETLFTRVQQRGASFTLQETTLLPANNTILLENPDAKNGVGQAASPQVLEQEYLNRLGQQSQLRQRKDAPARDNDANVVAWNLTRNGENWFSRNPLRLPRSEPVAVSLGPLVPLWLPTQGSEERLVLARLVQVGPRRICQGIVLDWARLEPLLAQTVSDLFPDARLRPVREDIPPQPERTMAALPLELDPGPPAAVALASGWTSLRLGLALAWTAAVVALLAVGLGGWSLLDLSERRIRFVSAVTHELRTPLTTLRLYLDMLAGGMVQDEKQKVEYLQTLNTESDRLSRLVGNVLDFSRLENQRPRLARSEVALGDLLGQLRATWHGRCQDVGKELVFENQLGDDLRLHTDVQLVQQIVSNLIDNACKYSRDAEDRRIWVRARQEGSRRLVLEVEDRGPGVPPRERRSIFHPFRRGRGAEVTAGGVGLGLALAQRWAGLLGGRLTLHCLREESGACFRLEFPF
jgi:signal transduction histidine kinase